MDQPPGARGWPPVMLPARTAGQMAELLADGLAQLKIGERLELERTVDGWTVTHRPATEIQRGDGGL